MLISDGRIHSTCGRISKLPLPADTDVHSLKDVESCYPISHLDTFRVSSSKVSSGLTMTHARTGFADYREVWVNTPDPWILLQCMR